MEQSSTPIAQSEDASKDNPEEKALLLEQAQILGIKHSPNISVATLKKKIQDKLAGTNPETGFAEVIEGETEQQRNARLRKQMHDTQMRLVRCRITNHNPAKAQLPGEIISVGNELLGTVKKYIPFNEAAHEYHVPFIIYNELINRQYNAVSTKKGKYNVPVPVQKLVPEYSVQVLPDLTQAQLDKLAASQAAANFNSDD